MSFRPFKPRDYEDVKTVVARLFREAGGAKAVMALLKLSKTRVYAFTDPDSRSDISYARVARITQETGAQAAAEHLAGLAGGAFLPIEIEGEEDWYAIAGEKSRSNARTLSALLESLGETSASPGYIDAEEARTVLRFVDRQMALLALTRSRLMRIAAADADDDAS